MVLYFVCVHPLASKMFRRMVIGMESVAEELPYEKLVIALETEEKPDVINPVTTFAPGAQPQAKVPDPN